MILEGTVTNGVVVLDGSPQLPEGQRVIVDLKGDDGYELPPSTETYAEHLASLRQSLADIDAGIKGIPLDEAMERIATEFNLPNHFRPT